MPETDPDTLPTSKKQLAVIIINGYLIYAKSLVLASRLPDLSSIIQIIVTCKISSTSDNSPQPLISLCF